MSKNLTNSVLSQIKAHHVHMHPRWVYLLGNLIGVLSLIILAGLAMLALNLIAFSLTHPGYGASLKVMTVISNVPWYLPAIAIVSLLGAITILSRYDFSYQKNFAVIILVFLLGLFIGSYALNQFGLDSYLTTRGYFRNSGSLIQTSPSGGSVVPPQGTRLPSAPGGSRQWGGQGGNRPRSQP